MVKKRAKNWTNPNLRPLRRSVGDKDVNCVTQLAWYLLELSKDDRPVAVRTRDGGFIITSAADASPQQGRIEPLFPPNSVYLMDRHYQSRIKRDLQKADPEGWRRTWEKLFRPKQPATKRRQIKRDLQKADPEGWRRTWEKLFRPRLKQLERAEGWDGSPNRDCWGVIWLLKSYFETVAEGPRWSSIAALLNMCQDTRAWTAQRLRYGWAKRKGAFEVLDGKTALCGSALAMRSLPRCTSDFQQFLDGLIRQLSAIPREIVIVGVKFTLRYYKDRGRYVGSLREVQGVFGQGRTLKELEEKIRKAYQLKLKRQAAAAPGVGSSRGNSGSCAEEARP